ncbi:MAG: HAD family phosphatase [Clostridia bacterium]|nr:HAD family phosphatase [Clostridia bacterium]
MRTYLFDFDGTLVDSMPTYVSVMLKILSDRGIAHDDELVKTITPLGYKGTAKYYIERFSLQESEAELVESMGRYALNEYLYRIPAKKNVVETLRFLKARGDSLNVLTASPHLTLDPCLKRIGIYDLFSNVWSCEDFATTKSDPQIYRRAAKALGMPASEILFLDDNYNALKTAKSAGMKVCGVFDESSKGYEKEIREIADFYVDDFAPLPAITW